jgi:hypothetical protein
LRCIAGRTILGRMRIPFLARAARAALPLLAFLAVGACTHYEHIPPATPEGQACVAQCSMMRSQCVAQQNSQLQQCNIMRSAALTSYNRCRAAGGGHRCVEPPFCTGGSYQCSAPYDDCFRACGGRIVAVD